MDHDKEQALKTYLKMVEQLAFEILKEDPDKTALEALRYAANRVEGQMQGY